MAGEQHVTLGEVHRLLVSLDGKVDAVRSDLAEQRTEIAVQATRTLALKERLDQAEPKIESMTRRSAFVSGGIAALGFLAQLVPWPWKHP